MQNTETGYASSVNVTKSRTRRKVTGEPRTLKGVRVVRRGGARKRVSRLRETPRRAPYPVKCYVFMHLRACRFLMENGRTDPPDHSRRSPFGGQRPPRPCSIGHCS